MNEKLGEKQRLLHIFDAIEEIESYIKERNQNDFDYNSMMRFATIKQLEIIVQLTIFKFEARNRIARY